MACIPRFVCSALAADDDNFVCLLNAILGLGQGDLAKAVGELIRRVPEQSSGDARAKLLTETELLREHKMYAEAEQVMAEANKRFPDDTDLPVDGNQCTQDVCTAGVPSNPAQPADTAAVCDLKKNPREAKQYIIKVN